MGPWKNVSHNVNNAPPGPRRIIFKDSQNLVSESKDVKASFVQESRGAWSQTMGRSAVTMDIVRHEVRGPKGERP